MRNYRIASVNMRHMNASMHVLLETNKEDNILLVQEPWFRRIGMKRCDDDLEGRETLGGTAHPKWELLYPYYTNNKRAKVMTYACIHNRECAWKKNAIRAIPRPDLAAHPCIQILDLRVGQERW